MKVIVENAIEEYADKNSEYPKRIEINETDFKILEKEERREKESIGEKLDRLEYFRGCKVIINNNIRKVRVSGDEGWFDKGISVDLWVRESIS